MPRALAASPRKMLPPPITTAGLHAERLNLGDVLGDARGDGRVDAVRLVAHQGFARQLQEDAFVEGGEAAGTKDYTRCVRCVRA